MKPTSFTAIRHGETLWNIAGMIQGHLDSPLTPTGNLQANALAKSLASKRYDYFYSSDLGRTMQTAQVIADRLGMPIQTETGLRERQWGIFQGTRFSEIATKHPRVYQEFIKRNPDYQIPEGESFQEFFTRTVTTFEAIATRHPGANIFVVTHGGNLDCMMRKALNLPLDEPRRFSLKNVSVNLFTYNTGQWRLETWGDISHLSSLTARDEL